MWFSFSVDSGVNATAGCQIFWKALLALPGHVNLHYLSALYIFNSHQALLLRAWTKLNIICYNISIWHFPSFFFLEYLNIAFCLFSTAALLKKSELFTGPIFHTLESNKNNSHYLLNVSPAPRIKPSTLYTLSQWIFIMRQLFISPIPQK